MCCLFEKIKKIIVDFFERFGKKEQDLAPEVLNEDFLQSFQEVDILALRDVIAFFKQPDILKQLKENKHLIAAATRGEQGAKKYCQACLFDTEKEEVADFEDSSKGWLYKEMDKDLQNAFGNKSMIVLQ